MASRDPPEAWELPLSTPAREAGRVELGAGAAVLTGYAADRAAALLKLIEAIGGRYVCTAQTPAAVLAAELGGFDLVLEATGDAQVMLETIGLLRRNGVACLLGLA